MGRANLRRLRPLPDCVHPRLRDALPVTRAVVAAPHRRDLGVPVSTDELLALIAAGIADVTGRPAPALTVDADLATLGLDSLQALELVAWAEERLRVRVPDEELATVRSIGDLSGVLAARLPAGTP
ncbi:acyl carrier protein [Micromonospora sp. MP36]|nr:acyl carrier protein [Micromonospora sp. MP36]